MELEWKVSVNTSSKWTFVLDEATRILFVDDDLILAEFARVHLASPSTTIEVAADGAQAWERLNAEPFDIVLLDIEMPTLDGFQLLQKVRADARFAHLPVVMLTGREDIASIDRAFQLGANSFVSKPINWRQLSYSIRYVLRATRMERDLLRERKRSEELLELTNNLLSLIRLEARTPLSAIIGFCDCISQQIDGPVGESYLKYAEQIGAAARQMQGNFMDLIQYAQLSSGAAILAKDEYPVVKLIDAAVAGLTIPAETSLEVTRPDPSLYLQCDLMWLSRAIRHLLEAALAAGGHVELSMTSLAEGGVKLTISSPAASLAVARATSLESFRSGMGVGVAFARCVVDLHGGVMKVSNAEHKGSIIEIVIPSRPPETRSAPPSIEAA